MELVTCWVIDTALSKWLDSRTELRYSIRQEALVQDTKLTIRVPRDVLVEAKGYAHLNRTTLTRLVSEYLRRLADEKSPLAGAPTVRRLTGVLSSAASVADYRAYLEEKYDSSAPRTD
jgi:hypothetical protein